MKEVKLDGLSAGVGCLLGLAAGAAGSYLLSRRLVEARFLRDFDQRLDQEVVRIKAHYNDRLKEALANNLGGDESASLGGDAGQNHIESGLSQEVVDEELDQHTEASGADEVPRRVVRNAFVDTSKPAPGKIRYVSRAEFEEVPPSHQVLTLIWYDADGVLCDDQDAPAGNIYKLVGPDFSSELFKEELSGDPHILLVVNDEMDLYLEVILNEGSYTNTVLGYGNPVSGGSADGTA